MLEEKINIQYGVEVLAEAQREGNISEYVTPISVIGVDHRAEITVARELQHRLEKAGRLHYACCGGLGVLPYLVTRRFDMLNGGAFHKPIICSDSDERTIRTYNAIGDLAHASLDTVGRKALYNPAIADYIADYRRNNDKGYCEGLTEDDMRDFAYVVSHCRFAVGDIYETYLSQQWLSDNVSHSDLVYIDLPSATGCCACANWYLSSTEVVLWACHYLAGKGYRFIVRTDDDLPYDHRISTYIYQYRGRVGKQWQRRNYLYLFGY